jgi:transposase, IS30 family
MAHLRYEQRVIIEHGLLRSRSLAAIARELSVHRSTLTNELKNNTPSGLPYRAEFAQYHAEARRRTANGLRCRIVPHSPLEHFVIRKLRERWSPDEIARRWNMEEQIPHVCPQVIYDWITIHRSFRQYLLLGRKRRRKQRFEKVTIPNRRMIDTRPKSIECRKKLGHWEGDTIVSKCRRQAIATFAERKSGYLIGGKMEDRTAGTMNRVSTEQFKRHCPKPLRKTCTNDNGSEFAEHAKTEKALSMTMYFAFPYHSWERGTNENTNRLLRAFFPKSMRFDELTQKDVDHVVEMINHRPRKRLGYRTPYEVFKGVTECCVSG